MAQAVHLKCFSCQKDLAFAMGIPRRAECEACRADVHVCLNCKFYDKISYNECRESSAEVVQEKERANFCDYFVAGLQSGELDQRKELLSAAEALFKKK